LNIYIALLQENYSEALPTPARLNKAVYAFMHVCFLHSQLRRAAKLLL